MTLKIIVRNFKTLSYFGSYKKIKDKPFKLYAAALLGTGLTAYSQLKQSKADMKEIIQIKNYMAAPITPLSELEKNQNDMKAQMEMLIMRIQAEFCRALEQEEDEAWEDEKTVDDFDFDNDVFIKWPVWKLDQVGLY